MRDKDRDTRKDWGGKIRVQSLHKPLVIAYIRDYHISSSVMILICASPECYLLPLCVDERKIILMGSGILVFLTPHASQDHWKKQLLAARPGAGTAWTGIHCPVETQFSSSWTWTSASAPDFKPFHKLSLSVILTAVLTEETLQGALGCDERPGIKGRALSPWDGFCRLLLDLCLQAAFHQGDVWKARPLGCVWARGRLGRNLPSREQRSLNQTSNRKWVSEMSMISPNTQAVYSCGYVSCKRWIQCREGKEIL